MKDDVQGYNIRYVLGLMNSDVVNYYHQSLVLKGQDLHPQVLVTNLPKLPIRQIDFSNAIEKARHDEIVSLVTQMLNMNRELLTMKAQADQELYRQQIADTNKKIDKLVCELYSLAPSEIAIVTSHK